MTRRTAIPLGLSAVLLAAGAAARPPNYEESRVAPYTLPDPLVAASGLRLTSPDQWPARRKELLGLFESQMFGVIPPTPATLRLDLSESGETLGGQVLRKQLRMTFRADGSGPGGSAASRRNSSSSTTIP